MCWPTPLWTPCWARRRWGISASTSRTPEYSGADSLKLARRVAEILHENGWKIENIDSTILCQRPKLAAYIPAMREKLAEAFGLPVDAVSVKATTEEHLGFTGEGLGIAAHAVALIEKL